MSQYTQQIDQMQQLLAAIRTTITTLRAENQQLKDQNAKLAAGYPPSATRPACDGQTLLLISRLRQLAVDHEPDGYPAVQMKEITTLCDIIDEQAGIIAAAKPLITEHWSLLLYQADPQNTPSELLRTAVCEELKTIQTLVTKIDEISTIAPSR